MKYTIEEIEKKIQPVAKKYNISEIYLFGSYARSEATEDSDIDLAINSVPIRGLLQLIAFKQELSEALDSSVDLLTLAAMQEERNNPSRKEFLEKFSKECIKLYE